MADEPKPHVAKFKGPAVIEAMDGQLRLIMDENGITLEVGGNYGPPSSVRFDGFSFTPLAGAIALGQPGKAFWDGHVDGLTFYSLKNKNNTCEQITSYDFFNLLRRLEDLENKLKNL